MLRPWSWLLSGLLLLAGPAQAASDSDDSDEFKSIPLRTHSLSSPYLDSDMTSRWFDFGGDLVIRTDRYIRLASDTPSQSGWIFSRIPLTATNWEIEIEFEIHGKGHLHADGFALWITKERATPGTVFGHTDGFEGLGIFFDTYKNNRPGVVFPYVMAMMGDGNTPYDSANDGKANEIGGCSARGLRGATIKPRARLTYIQDTSLTLDLQYKTADTWTQCFKIDASAPPPNLPPNGLKLPSTSYLGLSAHTGELSDNFDIISLDTRNLYKPVGPGGSSGKRQQTGVKKQRPGKNKGRGGSGGSWLGFFFKLILFAALCAGGYYGYKAYKANNNNSRFKGL
ncbi:hypothetical protein DV737_g5570, partial [Chaetothyriales sp. CBS 132003]